MIAYLLSYIALTDTKDVARVEFRTIISTKNQLDTIPTPREGFKPSQEKSISGLKSSKLGNWISYDNLNYELNRRLPGLKFIIVILNENFIYLFI
jgi:hypothetical protein